MQKSLESLMKYGAAIVALLLLLGSSPPAEAQYRGRDDGAQIQSLDSILDSIRRSRPGQLSDVQGPFGGNYRIKWLTPDGRVLWLDTDARTGRVTGVQGDDAPRGNAGGNGRFQQNNFRGDDGPEFRGPGNSQGNRFRGRESRDDAPRGNGRFRGRNDDDGEGRGPGRNRRDFRNDR